MAWRGSRQRRLRLLPRFGPWRKVAILAAVAFGVLAVFEGSDGAAPSGPCRVIWVTDGDTVRAFCPGSGIEPVRLLGFDTPEVFSPSCLSEWVLGVQATGALAWHVATAGETRLVLAGRDRYGRHLGRLTLDGTDVASLMVAAGLARPYGGEARGSWCG